MHDTTRRGLLVAGLSATVLFLALALIDYSRFDSEYMWPIFVAWALLILLLAILVLAGAMRRDTAAPALARAVANLSARPTTVAWTAPAAPPAETATAQTVPKPKEPEPSPAGDDFPFRFNGYTLYSRSVALKNGGERSIWFFSKRTPASGTMARKPAGFHVGVNERTGLPFLKRGTGKDGVDLTPAAPEAAYRPQCVALTEDGKQCRNSARADSKYCASHFGYQPKTLKGSAQKIEGESWSAKDKLTNKQSVARADTRARVKGAKDTTPAVRKKAA